MAKNRRGKGAEYGYFGAPKRDTEFANELEAENEQKASKNDAEYANEFGTESGKSAGSKAKPKGKS